ncbi:MAG: response regulator [Chloroflexia bacterium]|nr:response regulator [Chloroflexia bacterium]
MGLGLAIAKEHAEIIGGKLMLDSELGKGSKFSLILPYQPKEAVLVKDVNVSQKNKENSENMHDCTILVAEDDTTNFLYLQAILTTELKKRCNILHAMDGREAVNMCKNNKDIDLVLMDIKMPYMNGYEATNEIKKINPNIAIIVQTAYVTEEEMKKAKEAGCDGFITKPIDENELLNSIGEYLKTGQ